HGACPTCEGLGHKLEIDPNLLIRNPQLSLNEGAIGASEWGGPREEGGYYWQRSRRRQHITKSTLISLTRN
ncbi:MAG: hypothetical protein L3J16_03695, partial [Anaerolineales bacterium]|nr:hypothetical protein [Anaerolineales bacterium]